MFKKFFIRLFTRTKKVEVEPCKHEWVDDLRTPPWERDRICTKCKAIEDSYDGSIIP